MRISDWSSDVCSSDLCEALRTLIGEGINVNVTLLFSREAYRAVAEAYIDGVEIWAERNGSAGQIASVASFFVSRIDAEWMPRCRRASTRATLPRRACGRCPGRLRTPMRG